MSAANGYWACDGPLAGRAIYVGKRQPDFHATTWTTPGGASLILVYELIGAATNSGGRTARNACWRLKADSAAAYVAAGGDLLAWHGRVKEAEALADRMVSRAVDLKARLRAVTEEG